MVKKFKKYTAYIYTAVLFLLSIGLFVYIFPKEKQFLYDFAEGGIWRYEDLTSDGDYPILKSEQAIAREQDSIKKNFIYYYHIDTTICDKIISDALADISYFEATKLSHFLEGKDEKTASEEKNKIKIFKQSLKQELKKEFSNAITTNRDSLKTGKENVIKIKKDDSYVLYFTSDISTILEVNTKIINTIYQNIKEIDSLNNFEIHNILSKNISDGNLIYDKKSSHEMLVNQLNQLPLFSDFISNGELIIKKGDKIDSETYQKLLSLKNAKTYKSLNVDNFFIGLGVVILFFVLYFIVYLLNFYFNRKEIFLRLRNNTFFSIQILLIILSIFLILKFDYISVININIIPYTLIAALMISFFDFNISFFVYFLIILLSAFFAPNG